MDREYMWKTRWRILKVATASRIVIIFFMSVSCAVLPNFDPGKDVQKFELRLELPNVSAIVDFDPAYNNRNCSSTGESFCDAESHPFCYPEIHPDCSRILNRKAKLNNINSPREAIESDSSIIQTLRNNRFRFYKFVLNPLTRWDAARFLNLALYPDIRHANSTNIDQNTKEGNRILLLQGEIHEQNHVKNDGKSVVGASNQIYNIKHDSFTVSEQAHAFFPLFPLILRSIALNIIIPFVPSYILPPTLEATFVLTGLLWNITMFVLASVLLFDLTTTITTIIMHSSDEKNGDTAKLREQTDNAKERTTSIWMFHCIHCESVAELVAILFCFNPASVFFTTCYSEATFFTLTLLGHLLYRQCCIHQYQPFLWKSLILQAGATIYWMAAAYTRSNGILTTIWVFLQRFALTISCCLAKRKVSTCTYIAHILMCLATIVLIAYPMVYHDRCGYHYHCIQNGRRPTWCNISNSSRRSKKFSLYGYVQRKHWNVGLFRYYEAKQFPNFLLAFPVLCLGTFGPTIWIAKSVHYHRTKPSADKNKNDGKGWVLPQLRRTLPQLCSLISWILDALHDSHMSCAPTESFTGRQIERYLIGPSLLSDYALLACGTVLGATIAHVQISTRMIFSSFPAVYWFLAWLLMSEEGKRRPWISTSITIYFIAYNIVGTIMHPTWLPWT